jgi:hypothetical protein
MEKHPMDHPNGLIMKKATRRVSGWRIKNWIYRIKY